MNEKEQNPGAQDPEPEIVVNQYGQTKDPAVVVEEAGRTVLLTPDETLVIEKEPHIPIVPKNRPRNVYGGMWGRNELITVGLASFAFLIMLLIYFFEVIPSNRELSRHNEEAENLKGVLSTADARYGSVVSTEDQVAKIVASETDFETRYLPPIGSGRNELYQRLNSLIDAYGLTNTSGPDYSPLDMVNQQENNANQTDEQRGRDKFRSMFPGVYVTMTVEGSYQNLRRFIKDIEAGQEFIVIGSVQLTPSDNEHQSTGEQQKPVESQPTVAGPYARPNPAGPQQAGPNGPTTVRPPAAVAPELRPQGPKGKMHGELVSLHLEMAAYFRTPKADATLPTQ